MPLNTLTMGSYLYELYTYGLISPNRRLEYPGGTGSNPVKKKKKRKYFFLDFFKFIALVSFSLFVVFVLNITINTFKPYTYCQSSYKQRSWADYFEMV